MICTPTNKSRNRKIERGIHYYRMIIDRFKQLWRSMELYNHSFNAAVDLPAGSHESVVPVAGFQVKQR